MPTSSSLEVTPSPHDRLRLLFAAAGGLGLLLLVMTLPAVGAALIVAALAAWLVVRPMLGFAVFTWLLPFHVLVMAVLFGGLGISGTIVRAIAAWKETLIALLFGIAILRTVTGRGVRPFIAWLDLAVGGLFVISLIYLLAVNPFSGREIPFLAQAYGFRDSVFFALLYFVGRTAPEIAKDSRALRRLYLVAVLTSVIAILERILVPPETLVLLGAASYFQDFLGVAAYTQSNEFGLPNNYWTMIGGAAIRRVGSTYLSSQGFAVPFLLLMPAATLFALVLVRRHKVMAIFGYAILWTALLLSVTRMTIMACIIQLVLLAAMLRRWRWIAGLGVASVVAFVAALVMVPGLAAFILETLTFTTSSSSTHLASWGSGLSAMVRYPLGLGLGTADQTATRFGLEWITGDNQYLKYGVEIGWVGMLTHILILIGIASYSIKVFYTSTNKTSRMYGALVLATTVGIAINSVTAVVNNSMVLAYLYFWLAGSIVTIAQGGAGDSQDTQTVNGTTP